MRDAQEDAVVAVRLADVDFDGMPRLRMPQDQRDRRRYFLLLCLCLVLEAGLIKR